MQIYCFFDLVSEEYLPLWMARNDKQALKMVKKSVLADKDKIDINELRLFCLGSFDTETGEIVPEIKREINILISEDCE